MLLVRMGIDVSKHSNTVIGFSSAGQRFDVDDVCSHSECCCVQTVSSSTVFSHIKCCCMPTVVFSHSLQPWSMLLYVDSILGNSL